MSLLQRAATFGRMIKFSHSVFALPFAFVSGLIAYRTGHVTLTAKDIVLLLVCMVAARTAAMGFNRVADVDIDAINPRTKNRELPAGTVNIGEARLFTGIACAVFIAASFAVNSLCGFLSLPLLVLLLGYSLTKRYTVAAHFVLGLCLGMAPIGVWFALTGAFSWVPILLCLGVTLWTAGFDIYYSCQDEQFDRKQGLKSVPARLGALRSIKLVRPIHATAVVFYTLFGVLAGMGVAFYLGVAAIAAILIYEGWILRNGDLSRIDLAFFNLNGYVSILFAVATVVDIAVSA
ncbi:MAG: 4-hydroxybenzoate octaprenyltransferase [Chlorobi bacterium]|nr:4-hydroxybenzoate octaprenyltransferase [Chlorobiota bacterium]